MSEAKFTKGEWKVEGSSMSMGANYRGTFYVTSNCFDGDIFEASKANTNLIAAAPEMYEMLEKIHDSMAGNGEYGEFYYDVKELLAKARGEI